MGAAGEQRSAGDTQHTTPLHFTSVVSPLRECCRSLGTVAAAVVTYVACQCDVGDGRGGGTRVCHGDGER